MARSTRQAATKKTTKKPAKAAKQPAAPKVAKAAPKAKAAPAAKPPAAPNSAAPKAKGDGSAAKPWQLTTPPGSSKFTAYRDDAAGALVVKVGSTELRY